MVATWVPCNSSPAFVFQQAEELIKEIAVLEVEVAYLEKYLLSLYRKTCAHQVSKDNEEITLHCRCPSLPRYPNRSPPEECDLVQSTLRQMDSGTHRSQSSLSHRSSSNRIFPPMKPTGECDDTYHSLPLSMLEVTLMLCFTKHVHVTILKLLALRCSILFSDPSIRDQICQV